MLNGHMPYMPFTRTKESYSISETKESDEEDVGGEGGYSLA
jgi:hypothetical protein